MDYNEIFGYQILNWKNFLDFFVHFVFNLAVISIIAYKIYFRIRQKRDYLFTIFILNMIVFLVCYLLQSAKLSIGFAFGIFGLFSILRYRTSTIPIKEMTYVFIAISVAIINALSNQSVGLTTLIFTNFSIVVGTYIFEKKVARNESRNTVIYEKIELIKPERREELIADLRDRTGLNIHRIEVGRIDFLRDVARIAVFFRADTQTEDEEIYDND